MKKRCERHDCRKAKESGSKWCPLHTAEIKEAEAAAAVRSARLRVVQYARGWLANRRGNEAAEYTNALVDAVETFERALRELSGAEHALHALKSDGTRGER